MALLKPHMAKQLLPSPLAWLGKVRESCLHTPATRKQHICLWNMEIRAKRHSTHWDRVVLYVTLELPRWIAFYSGCDLHKAIFMGTEIDLKPIAFCRSTCGNGFYSSWTSNGATSPWQQVAEPSAIIATREETCNMYLLFITLILQCI